MGIAATVDGVIRKVEEQQSLPQLLARLGVGVMFATSGWGKLNNLAKFIADFEHWGIPLPHLQAPFVAGLEFVGGIMLVLGLLTRPFAGLLAGTMVVAIYVDRLASVKTLGDFLYLSEWLLLTILVWLVFTGSGKLGLDAVLAPKVRERLGLEPIDG